MASKFEVKDVEFNEGSAIYALVNLLNEDMIEAMKHGFMINNDKYSLQRRIEHLIEVEGINRFGKKYPGHIFNVKDDVVIVSYLLNAGE